MNRKNLSKRALICLLLGALLMGDVYAAEGTNKITIAIFPCTDVLMSFKKFHPLFSYLKEETGLDINMVVPTDVEEFERNIKNGDIAFALQDSHIYVTLASLYNKKSLLGTRTRNGGTLQSGVVIVRKDSGIHDLKDLKGRTVMFGPKLSADKWVAAVLLLTENGINIDKDLKSYSNGTCCEDIAFGVYLKAVSAGVVCDHFLEEHLKKQQELGVNAGELKVVGRTRPVPTKVFAARQGLSDDIVKTINQSLLKLDKNEPAHKQLLFGAELGGFYIAKDEDYDSLRILIGMKSAE